MHITSVGKWLIFTSAESLGTREDRAAFHHQLKTTTLDKDLCRFGFKKIRIQATNKENSGEEYDLVCQEAGKPKGQEEEKPNGEPEIPLYLMRPSATETSHSSPGAVSGKVFLITRGGDLKPARFAQVILLYGGVLGGSHDIATASIFYYTEKDENMKA